MGWAVARYLLTTVVEREHAVIPSFPACSVGCSRLATLGHMACTATSNLGVAALKFDADDSDETSSYHLSPRCLSLSFIVVAMYNLLGCSRY